MPPVSLGMGTISGCRHHEVNLRAKIYIYVNSTTQTCPKQMIKIFLFENFFHLPRHQWCTLSCEYLCEFSKKFEMALMVFSGAWGKLIHEKNQKSKISWHCSFKSEILLKIKTQFSQLFIFGTYCNYIPVCGSGKYFFRIWICRSVILTYGSGSRRIFIMDQVPLITWTFLWLVKNNLFLKLVINHKIFNFFLQFFDHNTGTTRLFVIKTIVPAWESLPPQLRTSLDFCFCSSQGPILT